jgi:hypothetical protein
LPADADLVQSIDDGTNAEWIERYRLQCAERVDCLAISMRGSMAERRCSSRLMMPKTPRF